MSRVVEPSALDMFDRISRSSFARHEHDHTGEPTGDYRASSTPSYLPSTNLAKTGSARIALCDARWIGLLVHSIVVGIVSTVLPLTVFPFLTNYLNMEGTQTLSARTLLAMPWMFRPLLGALTDSFALGRFRRRPYLVLGWVICAASLLTAYFITIPVPYFQDRGLVGIPLSKLTNEQQKTINFDAPSHGATYILLMTVGTTGYVMADVAADALIAEVAEAHFPPPHPTQESSFVQAVTTPRYGAMLFSFLFMGVGMSGWDYGGDFDFTLTYNQVMLIIGIVSLIPVPLGWFLVAETRPRTKPTKAWLQQVWALFENRAICFVIACRFIGGVFAGISATAVNPIAFYWAHVQPLNDNVVSFVATTVVLLVLRLAEKKGWSINFRITIIGANIIILILDCGATLFTIWDIVRSQWFWIGLPVMEALPSGLDYVILTIIVSEIAEPEYESVMRGIVTGVSFLAGPFGLTLTKYVDALFDVSNQDLMQDTRKVRIQATLTFLLAYVCQLLSLAWLFVLPRNGNEAREWKKTSGKTRLHATLLIGTLVICVVWSFTVHALSVNSSTSCLKIAGGKGC